MLAISKILFFSNDATRTGAPIVLLHLLKWLKKRVELQILLKKGGELERCFRKIAPVHYWSKQYKYEYIAIIDKGWERLTSDVISLQKMYQKRMIKKMIEEDFDLIYGNTAQAAEILNNFPKQTKKILHVHELDFSLRHYCNWEAFKKAIPQIDHFIAVSELVKDNLHDQYDIPLEKITLVHDFSQPIPDGYTESVSLSKNKFIVGSSGTINWRKGSDLFVQVAKRVFDLLGKDAPIQFVWLGGNLDSRRYHQVAYDVKQLDLEKKISFLGSQSNPYSYFEQFDLFLMTSREDPFPLVCVENAQVGNPIICFEGVVGSEEYINDSNGGVVPYLDIEAMANKVITFYQDTERLAKASRNIREAVKPYTVENSGQKILEVIESVIGNE